MKKITSVFLSLLVAFCVCTTGLATDKADEIISDTAAYIYETVQSPQIGSIGGEWAVIGLARSSAEVPDEYFQTYYGNVENYVKEHKGILHERKYTEYSRVILALTSIGKNPENVATYNLLIPLGDYEKTISQGINGAIWALIALDSGNYEIPQNLVAKTQATREMYIEYILSSQKQDGGWSLLESASQSDVDITAMALTALSSYTNNKKVSTAVEKALTMLSVLQGADGGFSGAVTCESTAQVLCALCSLGVRSDDSRFVKNGNTVVENLVTYCSGSGFKHVYTGSVNQMATEQAFYSLVALYRFENNMPKIMRMTDPRTISGNVAQRETIEETVEINFSDTKGHKNEEAIKRLAQKGIINGKSESVFDPENTMTRAEFATIIVKALGIETKNTNVFSDVRESDWFYGYVGAAYESGIINGVGGGLFNPYGTITRQEAAVMLSRASGILGLDNNIELMASRDVLSMYIDYIQTSDWAIKPLAFCISEGIINEEGLEILPKTEVKRGEIAQMVYNLLERVGRI